jgi:hypothetical protein
MLLVFVLTLCATLAFNPWKRAFSTRGWAAVGVLAFLSLLLVASISVCSVWTPYVTNWDFHGGEYDGQLPWSMLSYPFYLSVYHTPFVRLLYNGLRISGNVSFSIFTVNMRVMKIDGTFSFPPVFGRVPLSYSLNFPFSTGYAFFVFLLFLFTLLNVIGALLATGIAYVIATWTFRKG